MAAETEVGLAASKLLIPNRTEMVGMSEDAFKKLARTRLAKRDEASVPLDVTFRPLMLLLLLLLLLVGPPRWACDIERLVSACKSELLMMRSII